jgi:hypothetical protein
MWICLNDGFYSAVEDPYNYDYLYVRARNKEHLQKNFQNYKILKKKNSDYPFRIRILKSEFAEIIKSKILEIDYDNFKDSVDEQDLYLAYNQIWCVMAMYQMGYYKNVD